MSPKNFTAPSIEAMNALLPAFEFTDLVTSNALGAVYFAKQTSLGRQVAIKVFSPSVCDSASFRKSYGNASQLIDGLRHTNLIRLFDSGHAGEIPYRVLEFVPGKSLARSTRGQVVEFSQAMALFDGICEGLSYAHEKGLVHGHLNTLSILLNQQAVPKIGGFGLGRTIHTDAAAVVPTHCTAPEVHENSSAATVRSDVYSLAAIFYQLITGTPMAPGAAPASKLTTCKPEVDAVLKRATENDPAKRMADVGAFLTALKAAAKGVAPIPPPARDVPARRKVSQGGFGVKMFVKIAIIIGLLFGINYAWKAKEKAQADRAQENLDIIAKAKKEREDAIALARAQREGNLFQIAEQILPEAVIPETVIPEIVVPEPVAPEPEMEPEPEPEDVPIQGSIAAAIAADLAATRISLEGDSPAYPMGTLTSGTRHYLYVPLPVTWETANELAESGGGHLMVPSDAGEIKELDGMAASILAKDGFWLGATLVGNVWQWVTGEPWTEANWAINAKAGEEGSAVAMRYGKGWDAVASGDEASGFLIEWSDDRKGAKTGAGGSAAAWAAADLSARVKELALAADKKRSAALADNIKKFTWDLNAFVKNLNKSDQATWAPRVDALKECVEDDRILLGQIKMERIRLSTEMAKLVNYHLEKQGEIATQFTEDITKIRDAFLVKLTTIHDEVKASGQSKISEDIATTMEDAEDLDDWISTLGLALDEE